METENNYNDVLKKIQHYMLDETHMNNAIAMTISPTVVKRIERPKQVIPKQLFIPREKDSLFWCFYIMKHGVIAYEMLDNKNVIIDKKLKIEYVEKLRKDKQAVKMHKFASLTHIESKLANDDKIDVFTFLSLCVLENVNVLFVKKRHYFELLMNDGPELHIVHCLDNYKFGYELDSNNIALNVKNTLFKLDSITKPVNSISSYKVQELIDLCSKLAIETNNSDNKCKSKPELYDSIVRYFKN